MSELPKEYQWLSKEPGPRILLEGLKTFGVIEKPGPQNNPAIIEWARRVGLGHVYRSDATAWCGLWMAYVALQAGWDAPMNPLWARNWLNWGTPQPKDKPMLGDVLVFERGNGSGHVGIYVGEDSRSYYVLGGNQSDQVMIKRIAKARLLGVRRCPWRVNQPANVRPIRLALGGALSSNEA